VRILNAEYLKGIKNVRHRGDAGEAEICFIGRSNVGKSSMINKLLLRQIARTSSTPGATRLINLYKVHYETQNARRLMIFSDFPGFGYAKVAKSTYSEWEKMIEGYIAGNSLIRRIIWIFDVRRDFDSLDEMVLAWLEGLGLPFSLVLTKTDKESRDFGIRKRALLGRYVSPDEIFLFSSREGTGRKELLTCIAESVERPTAS
jgi:GTP-binding protein